MLSKLAQKIADITSEVIDFDVIVTDENAIIIGASDQARLGMYHEASIRVMATKKINDEFYYKDKKGTKQGITLPIILADRAIGAIGITGKRHEVEKFGKLVKKQAELLLSEEIFLKSSILREQSVQSLIREILVFNPEESEDFIIITRGYELGYDLKPPHIAIAINLFSISEQKKEMNREQAENESFYIQIIKLNILSKIRNIFNKSNDIVTTLGDDKFIILYSLYNNYDEEKVYYDVKQKCTMLLKELDNGGVVAAVGIGSIARDITELKDSYKDAWKSLEIGKQINNKSMVFSINEFNLEDLLLDISKYASKRFVSKALKNLQEQPDWPELSKTIKIWCESGFSQIEASKKLYIHRNTLKNRLYKIKRVSGIDLEKFKNGLTLYLAILMTELYN